jgi:hypothetical protein
MPVATHSSSSRIPPTSPYPTVVMVMTLMYKEATYCRIGVSNLRPLLSSRAVIHEESLYFSFMVPREGARWVS